tara:strand:+ start:3300 stop:3509 length:210 start_codon:yes stop_codon:yes gene_type:complete
MKFKEGDLIQHCETKSIGLVFCIDDNYFHYIYWMNHGPYRFNGFVQGYSGSPSFRPCDKTWRLCEVIDR